MRRILVVDDESGFRQIARRALERAGWVVEEAADGVAAIDALMRGRIDLVVVDLQMPDQAGIEIIGLFRELDPDVPIIAVSGVPIVLEDALVIGANLPLVKPFNVKVLLGAVHLLLEEEGGRRDQLN